MTDHTPAVNSDGCQRCTVEGAHTRVWHECEYGIPPEPTAVPSPAAPAGPDDWPSRRAGLRDQLAEALIAWTCRGKDTYRGIVLPAVRANAYGRADAVHIAAHDPARVLRETDARRRTLIRCEEEMLSGIPRLAHFAKQTVREMALPYEDRLGYAEACASYE